ncbi:hypothetical protein [Chryseobacterium sp. R2A-55]|uniref:hypothetical protein n=1 Tax=Chryseobacterium sp. R2A-55 TaxID=2744445 RepID=UPI001F28ED69|nr:hypothetical protein [Chryseobacterium sp. R2A-55]
MKKKLLVGIAALAMAGGLGGTAMANFNQSVNETKLQEPRTDRNALPQEPQVKKEITIRKSYSGKLYRGEGISPKVYGMYHVKRGTHKRTNI